MPRRKRAISLPTVVWEDISPAIAKEWLENYNMHNRNVRGGLGVKYTRDRENGHWVPFSLQIIAFDTKGILFNGQHTLLSIAESKQGGMFLVGRGFDPKVRMVTDIGAPRRPAEILQLLGYEANNSDVAIVRQMMNGLNQRATIPEIVDAYAIHEAAAKAILAMFPTKLKGITRAPVTGPMARAWYFAEYKPQLQKFADILYTGLISKRRNGNQPVIWLRDYLLQLPHVGESMSREIYKMTETALHAFLNNEKLAKLVPTEEELFPLE